MRLTQVLLTNALTNSASHYNPEDDSKVIKIANSHQGYLTAQDLRTIFQWKLQPNHFVGAERSLIEFDSVNKGEIKRKTKLVLSAETDQEALMILKGLPQMKTKESVAVASCLLMVLDMNRFTVMDRRANETLVALRGSIQRAKSIQANLCKLQDLLQFYNPPENFIARSQDWPKYMAICRELSKATKLTLRDVDRALYSASGHLELET